MISAAFKGVSLGAVVVSSIFIAGCSDNIRQDLGLVGQGPDEFRVIKRRPLNMPAGELGTNLPTPQPGAPSLVEPRPIEEAQQALQGDAIAISETEPTASEAAFVAAAGAAEADDAIRDQILNDGRRPERLLDGILGSNDPVASPLNPAEEADRIAREAKATKNPDLELPVIEDE